MLLAFLFVRFQLVNFAVELCLQCSQLEDRKEGHGMKEPRQETLRGVNIQQKLAGSSVYMYHMQPLTKSCESKLRRVILAYNRKLSSR